MQKIQDNDITRQVNHIVAQLEGRDIKWKADYVEQFDADQEKTIDDTGAYEYLDDVLDIEYVVNSTKEYLGARVLVAFGGPNIWINTRTNQVEGYWWDDQCIRHFDDVLGINDVLSDMWECM